MKKKYTTQIYEEGLGANVFVPVNNKINKTSNKKVKKILGISWKIFYTIIAILIAIILFLITSPLI